MALDQVSRVRAQRPGRWLMSWQIQNLGQGTLKILSALLPHGRFRCEEEELDPILMMQPKESAPLDFSVKCEEPPGTIVENAFLILRVLWEGEPWRILARLRVFISEGGVPETTTELVTTQPVGFSSLRGKP